MAFASSNRVSVSIAPETTPGIKEPNFYDSAVVQRITGESLNDNMTYVNSEEIRADRQLTDLVQVSTEASGDLNIELSANAFDPLMESLLGSTFTTADAAYAAAGTTVDAQNTFNSTAAFSALPAKGQWIKVSGRTNTANNGYFQVSKTVAPTSSVITLEGTPLTIDATSESTTFAESSMLKMGTADKSFTIVKTFNDMDTVTYFTFIGMRVSAMSLSLSVGSIITGSFSFMGLSTEVGTVAPTGTPANETPAPSTDVLNAVGNIANVWIDGTTSSVCITDMSLDVDAALRQQQCIGTLGSSGIGQGRFNVSGNISLYFEDLVMYTKYKNATSFALSFGVEDAAGNAYIFTMGKVKFESATVAASGSDTDVPMDATYRAIMDSDTLTSLQIDKWAV